MNIGGRKEIIGAILLGVLTYAVLSGWEYFFSILYDLFWGSSGYQSPALALVFPLGIFTSSAVATTLGASVIRRRAITIFSLSIGLTVYVVKSLVDYSYLSPVAVYVDSYSTLIMPTVQPVVLAANAIVVAVLFLTAGIFTGYGVSKNWRVEIPFAITKGVLILLLCVAISSCLYCFIESRVYTETEILINRIHELSYHVHELKTRSNSSSAPANTIEKGEKSNHPPYSSTGRSKP